MSKFSKFVLGFLMGAFIGGGTSLLLTPYSGNRLKLEIRQYFDKASEDIQLAAKKKREELEIQLEELRTPQKIEE